MLLSARREGLAAHLREWALALRPRPWPKAALKAAPERAQSSLRRGGLFSRVGIWPLRGPWLSNSVTLRGDGGRSRGLLFPGAWREKDIGSFRHRRSLGGFEWGPAQLGNALLFFSQALVEHALEWTSCVRRFRTAPRQMTDGSPTGQASARARVGKRWPRPVDRTATEVLPRSAGQPFLFEAGTRDRCRRVRRSMALLKPLASGPGFCRVPDTSGVDVTFFLLFFDAGQAGRDRRQVRRPRARNPPCARRSHPSHPTRRPRIFPTLCTPLAPLACLVATLPPFALMCVGAQFRPSTSARVEGGVSRRRGGGAVAHVGRGALERTGGGRWGSLREVVRHLLCGAGGQ